MPEVSEHSYMSNSAVVKSKQVKTVADIKGLSQFKDVDFDNFTLSKGFRLYNFSSHVICVVDRTGIVFDIEPTYLPNFNGVVIIRDYEVNHNVNVDLGHLCNEDPSEDELLRFVFANGTKHRQSILSSLGYVFRKDQFNETENSYYLAEFDIQVSFGASTKVKPVHPFSKKGTFVRYNSNVGNPTDGTSSINFLLVDNKQRKGKRYMNVNGEIIKVLPTQNLEMEDGFYFHVCGNSNPTNTGKGKIKYVKMDESTLDEILFRTEDDALHYGDRKHKEEIERLELEADKLKEEHRLEKLKMESKFKDVEVKNDELEAKVQAEKKKTKELQEQYEVERNKARMKDLYEQRSAQRKDSSETIKVVGTISAAALGLAALWIKWAT